MLTIRHQDVLKIQMQFSLVVPPNSCMSYLRSGGEGGRGCEVVRSHRAAMPAGAALDQAV